MVDFVKEIQRNKVRLAWVWAKGVCDLSTAPVIVWVWPELFSLSHRVLGFLPRRLNWVPPHPQASVALPPLLQGRTHWFERGVPTFDEGTSILVSISGTLLYVRSVPNTIRGPLVAANEWGESNEPNEQRWASTLANRSNARHRSNIRAPPPRPLPPGVLYVPKVWESVWAEGQEASHS